MLLKKQYLTRPHSGSHSIPKNTQIRPTRGAGVDPYYSSPTRSLRDIWWSATGLVEGHSRMPAMSSVSDGLQVAFL